jgi:hypothetical protein
LTSEAIQCRSGKKGHTSYAEALAHLEDLERSKAIKRGSVYQCEKCTAFHVSARQFTVYKKKGRGKARSGVVYSGREAS